MCLDIFKGATSINNYQAHGRIKELNLGKKKKNFLYHRLRSKCEMFGSYVCIYLSSTMRWVHFH